MTKTNLTLLWCLAISAATPRLYAQESGPPSDSLKYQIGLLQQQIQALNEKVYSISDAQKKTRPAELNPSIGLVGEEITSYRTKGMIETLSDRPGGIDVDIRSVELHLAASVDPFAKAYAVINASADPVTGEAALQVEEAALQTTSLPWNLALKAGRFFGEFGRLSLLCDCDLPFVNRPLVLAEYIGGESRTDGFQINWLSPLSHYLSLTAGAGDQFGDGIAPNNPGDFRDLNELNYWGRLSSYFNLTPDWETEMGVSGLVNPSTEDRGGPFVQPDGSILTEKQRRLTGADFSLKWAPLRDNQFQGLTWGTEALFSDNRYRDSIGGNQADTISAGAWGVYSYLTWKFSREWSAGFLFDKAQNNQNAQYHTTRCSPYITWTPSPWNQLRLQYTHTESNQAANDDAVYLQWVWVIGSAD